MRESGFPPLDGRIRFEAAVRFFRSLYVDETGGPTGNSNGNNPSGKCGWQWVMITAVVTVFIQGPSRSTAAAIELLGSRFWRDCGERPGRNMVLSLA